MLESHRRILITVALWIAVTSQVGIGWADDLQVNTYTTGRQIEASVAVDADGDFVVVWTTGRGIVDPGYSIQGQRFNSDGSPNGGQFLVNNQVGGSQINPSVVMGPAGDFIVAWASDVTSSYSIQARRFTSDGSSDGVQFRVNTSPPFWGHELPSVAMDADGDFVIVWNAYLYDYFEPLHDIKGQRFASDGTAVGVEFRVNEDTSGTRRKAEVASDAEGNFIVVWRSNGSNSTGIQGRRFASDGSPLSPEFRINTSTLGGNNYPSVAVRPDGDFIVVWESGSSMGNDGSGRSIQGQRYSSDGLEIGGEFQVNTHRPGNQTRPAVAIKTDGEFIVAWESESSAGTDSSGRSIQGQLFASDGSRMNSQFQLNTYTPDDQRFPSVGLGADGSFIVAWESQGSGGTDTDSTSIQRSEGRIFADGFESGDTSAWSSTSPGMP